MKVGEIWRDKKENTLHVITDIFSSEKDIEELNDFVTMLESDVHKQHEIIDMISNSIIKLKQEKMMKKKKNKRNARIM